MAAGKLLSKCNMHRSICSTSYNSNILSSIRVANTFLNSLSTAPRFAAPGLSSTLEPISQELLVLLWLQKRNPVGNPARNLRVHHPSSTCPRSLALSAPSTSTPHQTMMEPSTPRSSKEQRQRIQVGNGKIKVGRRR